MLRLSSGDVISATNSLAKPYLPPLNSFSTWIEYVIRWANAPTRFPPQSLGHGFRNFESYGLTKEAIHVFKAMGSTTVAIDYHIQGMPAGMTLGQISRARTAIHQRLLLLPSVSELGETRIQISVYEACRTTALIYAIGVIYPIPNSFRPFQVLVTRLKREIESGRFEQEAYLSDLLLWMLVLGGIAAADKPERSWYSSRLRGFVKRWKISEWEEVENKMLSFLWLDSACGQGGRALLGNVLELAS